ncbi:hypothetical protein JX265_009482 [Neoarthrinium moseri]|uniref:tetrahydrofolate synthase n=1 Tax=Neoarthrinium moseri TaxID=1658444 RepID=A0A9P9WFR8_9PEZI|nr:hypothetical protein JX265_009482 [Neoarthrinium moseri]
MDSSIKLNELTTMAKSYADAIRILSEHSRQDLQSLDVIHVTGTKGKGSTCAFTDSLLRSHFQRKQTPFKVGLYTSPHLLTECERIRINFEPISEDSFARYFFEIWEKLQQSTVPFKPGYLQLLTLLSLHIFRKEGVQVAIYEVHAGGRYDATNVFDAPIVCGFTKIGLDHVPMLGSNVKEIAWNKSGIMKAERPSYSVRQDEEVEIVLQEEAVRIRSPLSFVNDKDTPFISDISVPAQRSNASLAVELANAYLARTGDYLTAGDIASGISQFHWPGRFHTISTNHNQWYLDLAHNETSIPIALDWFQRASNHEGQEGSASEARVLIFGNPAGRDAAKLMDQIIKFCEERKFWLDTVILTAYERRIDGSKVFDGNIAQMHIRAWHTSFQRTTVMLSDSPQQALNMAQHVSISTRTLIIGSSHLISNALRLLQEIKGKNPAQ